MFYLTHDPTNKTNVLASIYVQQSCMFNMICNVYYYKKLQIVRVCHLRILSIVRYIVSMYAKILQPLDMHGFPGTKLLIAYN